jgi:hypothetical protein
MRLRGVCVWWAKSRDLAYIILASGLPLFNFQF